jgi:sulfur carrier protein ThiS
MPECDYCGASHDSEEAHLEHLDSEHYDELGPIDRRRVDEINEGSGFPTGPVAIGVVLLAAAGIVGYVVFVAGGSGGASIGQAGSAHYHGTINVTITGDTFDFSRSVWKNPQEYPRFHFEGRSDDRWHAHATGMTLKYGMSTIGIGVEDDAVTWDGTTYVDGEGYEVVVQVNGNDVPPDYVLKDQDHIRIVVREA